MYAPGDTKDESAEAIRKFNDFVAADERVETVTLPIRDGVSIVQRRCQLVPCITKSVCMSSADRPVTVHQEAILQNRQAMPHLLLAGNPQAATMS